MQQWDENVDGNYSISESLRRREKEWLLACGVVLPKHNMFLFPTKEELRLTAKQVEAR